MRKNQSGFSHIILVVLLAVVLGVAGYSAFRFVQSKNSAYTNENAETKAVENSVKIKNLPITLAKYDPATGKAGDIEFPEGGFDKEAFDLIFFDFGLVLKRQNADGQDKANPQPTFRVAAGTEVRAIIDGEVVNVTKLYSNDYSIHMRGEGSDLIFETEHVINVKVKVGDQVKAGTIIATASDYDARNTKGLGLVEIGVLQGGKSPTHLCTFDFLDDSVKTDISNKIDQLKKDWAEFRGQPELYNEAVTPGCITRTPVVDNNNSATGTTN